jgi:hypothetical protein
MQSKILFCPWCGVYIEVLELNCGIFRCGTLFNGTQIPPRASKEECDSYMGRVYGCTKPFQIVDGVAKKCDYI